MKKSTLTSLLVIVLLFTGCGGSSGSNEDDVTTQEITSQTQYTATQTGIITFNVPTQYSSIKQAISQSNGKLIITTDKLRQAVDQAEKIDSENIIENPPGTFTIENIPVTTNASLSYIDENGSGFNIDDIDVQTDITKDLGLQTPTQTYTMDITITSTLFSSVWINLNSLEFAQKITPNINTSIQNIPKGNHFLTLSDINGNIILSKYITIEDANVSEIIDLDTLVFTGAFHGKIKNTSGEPLENTTIYLKPSTKDYIVTLSDNNGDFSFTHLPKGTYTVIIKKEGYTPQTIKEVNFLTQSDLGEIILQSNTTTGSITGYTYFSDVQEHAGIDITLKRIDGIFQTQQNGSLKDGAFLFTGLPTGTYELLFGKSSDSNYELVTSKEIKVLAGVTSTLNHAYILKRKVATLAGTLYLPDTITDVSRIKIEVLNSTNQVISSVTPTFISKENNLILYNYLLTVPTGSSYTLQILGSDQDGNDIKSISIPLQDLNVGDALTLDLQTIAYVDPNPPVLSVLNVTNISRISQFDTQDNLLVNPEDNIKIDVTAQDSDGDPITYTFTTTGGEFIGIDTQSGKATLKASNNGGNYTLSVTASSGSRSDTRSKIIHVNNTPRITLNSSTDLLNINTQPTINSTDIYTIATNVFDDEDETNVTTIWRSNIQGLLDTNTTTLSTILLPGDHIITQSAIDSLDLITTNTYYIKVLSKNMLWLKAPNTGYMKLYDRNLELSTSYQISISGLGNVTYQSLDTNVSTVDSNGLITSIGVGSTKIKVSSTQIDENGTPIYTYDLNIRVIDDLDNLESTYALKAGDVVRIKNDANSTTSDGYRHIPLQFDSPGTYELVFFDEVDIVSGSTTSAKVMINSTQSGNEETGIGNTTFTFNIIDTSSTYEIWVRPKYTTDSEYIKIALLPSQNVKDQNGKQLSSYFFDTYYEFNDIINNPAAVNISTSYTSNLHLLDFDKYDYYTIDLTRGNYILDYSILTGTLNRYGNFYVDVLDPRGNQIANSSQNYADIGNWDQIIINATESGLYTVFIRRETTDLTYYNFMIYPSLATGLIQDDVTFEPNNFDFNAYKIKVNNKFKASLNQLLHDNKDYYSIDLLSGNYVLDYSILTGTLNRYGNFYVQVIDPSGQVIVNHYINYTDVGNWGQLHINATVDGTYKIYIYREGSDLTYYDLNVYPSLATGLIQDDVTFEPNNFDFNTYKININDNIKASINQLLHDNKDYYSIDLLSGNYVLDYSILTGTLNRYGNFYVQVIDPSGQVIVDHNRNYTDVGDTDQLNIIANITGTYTVYIYRENNDLTYYSMEITQ